jgi:hypothetical protein
VNGIQQRQQHNEFTYEASKIRAIDHKNVGFSDLFSFDDKHRLPAQ